MSLETGKFPPRRMRSTPTSIVAAGRTLDLSSEKEIKELDKRPLPWQKRSYNFYDPASDTAVGEVWFAGRYVAESISRIRMVPAVRLAPDQEPIPVESEEAAKAGVTPEEAAIVKGAVQRLDNSHGGQADLMRGGALNGFLAGESYLIGRTVDNQEEWEIHSVEALISADGGREARLKETPDATPENATSLQGATVVRLWRRHPRFPILPDAAMGAALTYCEDLWTLTAMVRASARSRIPAGMLVLPTTASDQPIYEDDDEPDSPPKDEFSENLLKHLSTPLKNPSDAAALVPFILRLDPEDIEKIKQLSFGREIDRLAVDLREEARQAFAATIDLPSDVMTGKQGLNDWSAWNVDEETFRVHLAPHAELLVTGMTSGYLHSAISGPTGVKNPRRFCIWYDASDLVAHPNKAENAGEAHDRILISDAAARRDMGYDETDAPDDEERTRREKVKQPTFPGSVPAGGPENGAPTPAGPDDSVQASAASVDRTSLGYRLATIERTLIDRLLTAADAELRRALERAGNRIVASARKRTTGEAVRRIVASTPTEEVAARLGQDLVAALGLTDDALLNGAFDSLEGRWDAWVAQAQRQALAAIEAEGDPFSDTDGDTLGAASSEARTAGWAVLAGGLVAAATTRLYSTDQPKSLGERDSSTLIPPSAMREALSTAGGGPVAGAANTTARSGEGRGGLLSGDLIRQAFRAAALEEAGWVWVYGDPSSRTNPFEPHADLDGFTFVTWEDDVLANSGSFPDAEFYFPGDHDGCQCTFARDATATIDAGVSSGESDEESDE